MIPHLPRFAAVAALVLSAGGAVARDAPPAEARPDMLIYIADDHSRRDCSLYDGGLVETPHLEALAADGMRFTHAFVASPTCAPSRAALLTGLMPARNGAEENHSRPRESVLKLPAVLHELGYEVAAFGKVAHGKESGASGFDHVRTGSSPEALRRHLTAYLEGRTPGRPLCVFVGISHPHVLWPEETTFDPAAVALPPTWIDTPLTRRQRARYLQEVKELDAFLGELRALAAAHLRPDPLVAYTSDHGAQFPFGKFTLYDDGIRVPLVVSWPRRVAAGATSEALVSWVDLLPTLIELAGGGPPAGLDGYSFADALLGKADVLGAEDVHRAEIFATHSGDRQYNVYPTRAVRTRRWKYIRNLHPEYAFTTHIDLFVRPGAGIYWLDWLDRAETDPAAAATVRRYHARPAEELYDVSADPSELTNLADDPRYEEVRADLDLRLSAWMKRQGDAGTVFDTPHLLSDPSTWPPGRFAPPAP